jgi:hypothetical protein
MLFLELIQTIPIVLDISVCRVNDCFLDLIPFYNEVEVLVSSTLLIANLVLIEDGVAIFKELYISPWYSLD